MAAWLSGDYVGLWPTDFHAWSVVDRWQLCPRTYTRLGDWAFPVAGPRLWNSLPSTYDSL